MLWSFWGVCSFWFFGGFFRGPFEEFVPFGLLEEFGWLLVLFRKFVRFWSFWRSLFPFWFFWVFSVLLRVFWCFFGPFRSFWGVCSFWSFGRVWVALVLLRSLFLLVFWKSLVLLVFCVWVCSRTFFCFLYITWAATIGRDEIDTIEAKVINILFIFFI